MNGIFENAKFGDKFLTRNGLVALYHSRDENIHYLVVEGQYIYFTYDDYGIHQVPSVTNCDIVRKYDSGS